MQDAMSEPLDLDKVFMTTLNHYGEDVDSSTIPKPCGVLLLVYHTHGILDDALDDAELPDYLYWNAGDETMERLEAYVRKNIEAFPEIS